LPYLCGRLHQKNGAGNALSSATDGAASVATDTGDFAFSTYETGNFLTFGVMAAVFAAGGAALL